MRKNLHVKGPLVKEWLRKKWRQQQANESKGQFGESKSDKLSFKDQ